MTKPFQRHFVVRRLRLAMINMHTKFEVTMSTHYEDIEGNENVMEWYGESAVSHCH